MPSSTRYKQLTYRGPVGNLIAVHFALVQGLKLYIDELLLYRMKCKGHEYAAATMAWNISAYATKDYEPLVVKSAALKILRRATTLAKMPRSYPRTTLDAFILGTFENAPSCKTFFAAITKG